MSKLHLLGCPKEADPRNETCDCERLRDPINPLEYVTAAEDREFDAEDFARGLQMFCAQADGVETTLEPAWSNRHSVGFWARLISGREFSITVTRLR